MRDLLGPLANAVNRVTSHLMLDGTKDSMPGPPDLCESVEQAKVEWQYAREHFNHVSDPELIDHAIYQVKAAERRYMYLLGLARGGQEQAEGVSISPQISQ